MNTLTRWFAQNPIASNLLMLLIVISGAVNLAKINKEIFPQQSPDSASIDIAYPGAGPDEIVSNIIIPVEAAIRSIEGVKEISSTATEGSASISVSLRRGTKVDRAVTDVRAAVDGIQSFPADIERPQIGQSVFKDSVAEIAIYGPINQQQLTKIGRKIEKEVVTLPDVASASLFAPQREVSIEVPFNRLRQYGLTLAAVANAVRASSVDLPAGSLKAEDGDILIRTRARSRTKEDFAAIPVIETISGHTVLLGDIATIKDGFSENLFIYRFNGQNAVGVEIQSSKSQDLLKAAENVKEYLSNLESTLPEGVQLQVWTDRSIDFQSRLTLLSKNGLTGLFLVFVTLMLFMRTSLAFWVSLGIGISIMGTFWMMPILGVSLNIVSTFGFLLVLGIIVDDAIVVGESIHSSQEKGLTGLKSVIQGAENVSWPVTLGVLTSMVSVSPVFFFDSEFGGFLKGISTVMIATLAFSIIECFFILPSHMAHTVKTPSIFSVIENGIMWLRRYAQGAMSYVRDELYKPLLVKAYTHAATACSIFLVIAVVCFSLVASGRITMGFGADFVENRIEASIQFPDNVSDSVLNEHLSRLGAAFYQAKENVEREAGKVYQSFVASNVSNRSVTMTVEFHSQDIGDLPINAYTENWLKLLGDTPQASLVRIRAGNGGRSGRVELAVQANDVDTLRDGLKQMKYELLSITGVLGVSDSVDNGRPEISMTRTEKAKQLGITLTDLSRQVRQAFWGERVDRLPDETKSIEVLVRLDKSERRSLNTLYDLQIQVSPGQYVPLHALAHLETKETFSSVERRDGNLISNSYINIDPEVLSQQQIFQLMVSDIIPQIQKTLPGFDINNSGDFRNDDEFLTETINLFGLAILVIYAILAIGSASYVKPLIILSAIPFGFVGAIIGHAIFGITIGLFSAMGFIATAGVVINDNLVLVHGINRRRKSGESRQNAVINACQDRFRAIALTSLTTCAGLLPLLIETSFQAQMLIPTAISLSFGVAFCTIVTLILVPCLYALADSFKQPDIHTGQEPIEQNLKATT